MAATVVFGANGGIGSEVARQLRAAGNEVYLCGRRAAPLEELAGELGASFRIVEATDVAAVEDAFAAAADDLGELSGAVNCVGSLFLKPVHLTTEEDWLATIATNLTSSFAVVRAARKTMSAGSIVLMASAAATAGLANHEAIAAAKGGVIGLMRSAAASFASRQLRVNSVAPGLVRTEMTRRIWEREAAAESSRKMHPLGRLGEPAEVARLIVWLLDPANSWVTGQNIGIDGGLATVHPR